MLKARENQGKTTFEGKILCVCVLNIDWSIFFVNLLSSGDSRVMNSDSISSMDENLNEDSAKRKKRRERTSSLDENYESNSLHSEILKIC